MDNLTKGYQEAEAEAARPMSTRTRNRLENWALAWREDPTMESLLELQRTDGAAFDALPPTVRLQLGYYKLGREAWNELHNAGLL